MEKVRWSELERNISLDQLPQFHRAFLRLHRPELPTEIPLRRVQQYVTQTLYQLAKQGKATPVGEDFEMLAELVPGVW
jgi:hypothetical protein